MAIDTDGEFDPRWNNGLVLSSSRIELAGCPFAYFLKHPAGTPPDELSYDPNCWLNPLGRFTACRVFAVMQRIIAKNESPSLLVKIHAHGEVMN